MDAFKDQQQQAPEEPKFHYFMISGEIEYTESKFNKSPRYRKAGVIYHCPGQGIKVEDLKQIQIRLQVAFLQKRIKAGIAPPQEITDLIILGCAYLGMFSPSEFNAEKKSDKTPEHPAAPENPSAENETKSQST